MERELPLAKGPARQRGKMCLHLKTPVRSKPRLPGRLATDARGAEILEAAIVLPILLTLLIGTVWLGRAYNVYETMTRAAREGARFAVAPSCATCGNAPPTDAEVTDVINAALSAANMDPLNVSPAIAITRNVVLNLADPSSVQVSGVVITFGYPFQFVVPFTSLNMSTITISTSVQMRQEF